MANDEKKSLEEELSDLNNIDDSDELVEDESTAEDLFSISSYGVDHNVEALVKRLKSGQYYVPDFQRKYVWTQIDASKFIESLLLGLPVPGIFLYKEQDSPKHLVIDGQQRLKSLEKYYTGTFREKKFRLAGIKTRWAGSSYEELDDDDKLRLDDAIVHATIFKQDTPTDNMDSVYEVFERINTGGMKLSPQEIRSCVAYGLFNSLLFELNENSIWRKIFGNKSLRLKDIELVLRFFAFLDAEDQYKRPMKKFLTDFMTRNRNPDEDWLQEKLNIWTTTLIMLNEALGDRPFRPSGRALNVAFFDSFSVATAKMISKNPEITAATIKHAFDQLSVDDAFLKSISSSTADEENVKTRFSLALNSF